MLALLLTLVASEPQLEGTAIARAIVAETALRQARAPDPAWHPEQRDCAGLVRFAFRAAFEKLEPHRLAAGPWRDAAGRPSAFADAETLLSGSFRPLGRGDEARRQVLSGDLAAFRRDGEDGAPVYHLMLIAKAPARGGLVVVYHPGSAGAEVRTGPLLDLIDKAPLEWRPVPQNRAFLGFYRLKEWM